MARRRIAVLAAAAIVAGVVVVGVATTQGVSRGGGPRRVPRTTQLEPVSARLEISGVDVSVIEDAVWVSGGFWEPSPLEHGSSTEHDDVSPNRTVYRMNRVGEKQGEVTIPLPKGEYLITSAVVRLGGTDYLLGNTCLLDYDEDAGWGCNRLSAPLLYDLSQDPARSIALDKSIAKGIGDAKGQIHIVGVGDNRVWLTQTVGEAIYQLDTSRLLSIDVTDGAVSHHQLPEGALSRGGDTVCLGGDDVYAVVPTIGDAQATRLTIMRTEVVRPDVWTAHADVEPPIAPVTSGRLDCVGDIVLLQLGGGAGAAVWMPISATTGELIAQTRGITPRGRTSFLFRPHGDGDVFSSQEGVGHHDGVTGLWRLHHDGSLEPLGHMPGSYPARVVGISTGEAVVDFGPVARLPTAAHTLERPGPALWVNGLAPAMACEGEPPVIPAVADPAEPVTPVEAFTCRVGEHVFTFQTYASTADRDAVMAYLHRFSGYRVVGPRWIVAVDTPEAGRLAATRLDSTFVRLRG